MMKARSILFSTILTTMLLACSGSDTYRGVWKAVDAEGVKYEIVFDENSFTIKDSMGKSKKMEYSQHSININNGVETYGIRLEDGREYQIHFPISSDESIGLIMDGFGHALYTIGRKDYVETKDLLMF